MFAFLASANKRNGSAMGSHINSLLGRKVGYLPFYYLSLNSR